VSTFKCVYILPFYTRLAPPPPVLLGVSGENVEIGGCGARLLILGPPPLPGRALVLSVVRLFPRHLCRRVVTGYILACNYYVVVFFLSPTTIRAVPPPVLVLCALMI